MPQVIDAPEAVQEEQWYQDEEKTTPQSTIIEPQHERTRVLASLRSAVGSLLTRHPRHQSDVIRPAHPFELPIDWTAREHPILFITAMFW